MPISNFIKMYAHNGDKYQKPTLQMLKNARDMKSIKFSDRMTDYFEST